MHDTRARGDLSHIHVSGIIRGVSIRAWWNTQTPGQLPEVIRSECSELVCFHLDEDKTLEWPTAKGLDADEIRALPNLHFVARNVDSRGELRGRIEI